MTAAKATTCQIYDRDCPDSRTVGREMGGKSCCSDKSEQCFVAAQSSRTAIHLQAENSQESVRSIYKIAKRSQISSSP